MDKFRSSKSLVITSTANESRRKIASESLNVSGWVELVGNKAKERIATRVFQKNKASQIF